MSISLCKFFAGSEGGGASLIGRSHGCMAGSPRPLLDPRVVLFCYRRLCILGHHRHGAIEIGFIFIIIMRPSSVGGAAYCVALCLSVCPSVPCLLTLEHRSRVFVNLADVRYLLFCLHLRAAYRTAISAAQACYFCVIITVYTCRTTTCKYCIENIIRIQILFNVFNVLYFNLHIFTSMIYRPTSSMA